MRAAENHEPTSVLAHSFGAICTLEASIRTKHLKKMVLYEPPLSAGVPIYSAETLNKLETLPRRTPSTVAIGLKHLYRLESIVGRNTSRPISAATYKTLTCAIARNCSLGAACASDNAASGHDAVCEELFQLWVERLIRLVPRSKTSVKVQKTLAGRHESDLVGRRQAQLYPAEKTDQSGQSDDDQGIGPSENKDQRAKAGQQKSSPVVVS
jgi:hypothetical protein